MDNNSAFSFGDTYDATLIARCPIAFGRGNCTKRGVGRAERVTMQAYDLAYKLCVIGDAGVGKTCIIQRFAVSAHAQPALCARAAPWPCCVTG